MTEDVRMSRDELVYDAGYDIVDRKRALAPGQLRLKDHLKEQVTELFAQGLAVAAVECVDHLARLLEHLPAKRFEGLLAIPGATVGIEEASHDADQTRHGRPILPRQGWDRPRLVLVEPRHLIRHRHDVVHPRRLRSGFHLGVE